MNPASIMLEHVSTDQSRAALGALEVAARGVSEARQSIEALDAHNVALQARNSELQAHSAALEVQRELNLGQIAALETEVAQLRAMVETARLKQAQLEGEKQALEAVQHQRSQENEQLNAQVEDLVHDLEASRHAVNAMHERISDLHQDLRAEDLPTLIIKLAMELTGAQVGLFTEADGDGTLAKLGFEELAPIIVEALYGYSRDAAHAEAPVVENDGSKLPDGSQLVNLAALPVATQGQPYGVLLLADKREGPFTEHDTRLLLAIGQHAGIALENSRLHARLTEAYASTVAVLADAIEAKDAYTRGHCEDVARVAVEVAYKLGLRGTELDDVRYAALLHDVGKIGVPDGVLLKPGKLMAEEFSIIQRHARIGHDLVSRVPALASLCDAILHHHEHWNGGGYPDGLSGEGIPLVSRIIGAVDAYDAMTTPRPYRVPVSSAEALNEMGRCAGTQFDPDVVAMVRAVVSSASVDGAPGETTDNESSQHEPSHEVSF